MAEVVIALVDVAKVYPMADEEVHALRGVSVEIMRGQYAAVVGPSGSGKSTMMNVIGCLDRPTRGRYLLSGVDVSDMSENALADTRNQRIGFVFQTFNLLPRLSAYDNVELPLVYQGLSSRERAERVERRLREVGLWERRKHRPAELSGGQRQRVAIARALVSHPALVLADEPTANLDSETGTRIIDLMRELNQSEGTTFIFSTHDPKIMTHADRLVQIKDGRVVEPAA